MNVSSPARARRSLSRSAVFSPTRQLLLPKRLFVPPTIATRASSMRRVITSYSIHYTKLYERCHISRDSRETVRIVGVVCEGRAKKVALGLLPALTALGEYAWPRITSYNVCYTKVLRQEEGR